MDVRGDELSNVDSDRVRSVRSLTQRSVRERSGAFIVEGPQAVREAVRWAGDDVTTVYLTRAAAERYPEIVEGAPALRLVTPEVAAAMSADAQGVVAVARISTPGLGQLIDGAPRLVCVLAQVRDPGNAGTVIRAADAAGAAGVVLAGPSVEVHNPKVVRSTVGSLFHLPVVAKVDLAGAVTALRAAGLQILAADGAGDLDLDDLADVAGHAPAGLPDLSRPTAWIFGNEAWGLPEADRAMADHVVRVPIHGHAESLNLATAATVCLYASARALR